MTLTLASSLASVRIGDVQPRPAYRQMDLRGQGNPAAGGSRARLASTLHSKGAGLRMLAGRFGRVHDLENENG